MILLGDCLERMGEIAPDSVDAIVTDPPYGLAFMGKGWDHAVPGVPFWAQALRVAKPGAYLAAFGGTRTFHRLACAIEDAGWELRDTLMWVYASGFPKSHNGEWGGTALKPAWEPIILARKPLIGTVAANHTEHGTGGLNIDACRIESEGGRRREDEPSQDRRYSDAGGTNFAATPGPRGGDPDGRWPANLVHDGSDEVVAAFPQAPGQQGDLTGDEPSRPFRNAYGVMNGRRVADKRGDSGSAARFFYCAKASRADRNSGLNGHEWVIIEIEEGQDDGTWEVADRLARLLVDTGQSRPKVIGASGTRAQNAIEWSTSLFGSAPMERPRMGSMCTTETATSSTTGLTILSYFQNWLTSESTQGVSCVKMDGGSLAENAEVGTTWITTTSASMGSALGVDLAVSKTRFRISVSAAASDHPTVKPTELMRWLCRLVTPAGGLVLDPFTGSGSTGRGAVLEGLRFLGCELDPQYVAIAEARIASAVQQAADEKREADDAQRQAGLFT